MLSEEQFKFIEYLVTGHTLPESAKEVGISAQTGRAWLKQVEVVQELSRATEVFEKEVTKARSRQYRIVAKKILDKILEKIDQNKLDDYAVDELIKMLNKSVVTMRDDSDVKKVPMLQQNNLTINANVQAKFEQKEFVDRFSGLLLDMSAEDIQQVAEAHEKMEREQSAGYR